MYPGGPTAGNYQAGYPPPLTYHNGWGTPVPGPAHSQGSFPPVYQTPPYPPPQMYPAPPAPNPQTTGPTPNFGYGVSVPVQPVQPQAVKQESPSFQWPDGNVKVECTTGQEPSGWDDQGWMWRSSGARKLGLPDGAFKVDKRVCLGVSHCGCCANDGTPNRFFRPKKEKAPRDKQRSESCHICRSTLTITYSTPCANIAGSTNQQVRENPSLTAQKLRAGAGPTQVALGDINPVLLGARKARKEVENSKVQTPFMREVLLQDQIRSWHEEYLEAESGRHGLVTDCCHDFFKEGILLTSLVFSQILMRWAPVLFTWIGMFDERHHKSHFDQLVYVIAELCTRGLGIPGWNTLSHESRSAEASALRARAEALIKGCIVHWKRSLHKIKQVIGKKHLYRFEMLINVLESERTTPVEFLQAVEQIRADFPEKMPAELRAKLPNSTNVSESNHWLLYRAVGFGFDLWEGIRRLYRFQRETEMLYAAIFGHVDARFQGSKPKPKSRIKWHPNDGRAPDTRERLEAIEKIEG
ncbi:hypothetical protein DFH09DRAFT_1088887 [Mycena vulgaris]|nr:hypothetical protein DFH09DRAFT_1088887 [Mycena vulgaris]